MILELLNHLGLTNLVRSERLELSRENPHGPQPCLSTNSSMTAFFDYIHNIKCDINVKYFFLNKYYI